MMPAFRVEIDVKQQSSTIDERVPPMVERVNKMYVFAVGIQQGVERSVDFEAPIGSTSGHLVELAEKHFDELTSVRTTNLKLRGMNRPISTEPNGRDPLTFSSLYPPGHRVIQLTKADGEETWSFITTIRDSLGGSCMLWGRPDENESEIQKLRQHGRLDIRVYRHNYASHEECIDANPNQFHFCSI
jgi:hypothetical protein